MRGGEREKIKNREGGGNTKNLDKFIPCSCSGRIREKGKIAKMIYSDALKTLKKPSAKIRRKKEIYQKNKNGLLANITTSPKLASCGGNSLAANHTRKTDQDFLL